MTLRQLCIHKGWLEALLDESGTTVSDPAIRAILFHYWEIDKLIWTILSKPMAVPS